MKMKLTNVNYEYPRAVMHTCAEIVVTVTEISKQASANYDMDDLHGRLCAKFDSVIKSCRVNSLPDDAALELLYPLAALVDETVLSIPHFRYYWSERPLQLRYFGEIVAGTKFFAKLEALINSKNPKKEVLELYFFSLALGLKGMHGLNESPRYFKLFENLGIMLKKLRQADKKDVDSPVRIDKKEGAKWGMLVPAIYSGIALFMFGAAAIIYFAARADLLKFLDNF